VAILPFENLSVTDEDMQLASGLGLEIGSLLSRVGDLRLISRTAVADALAAGVERSRVGLELGAGSVLDGTLQLTPDRVRITVQLSDAAANQQLWGATYDGEIGDLFALQSEVALSIVAALEAALTPDERARIETPSTTDLAAYRLYQRQADLLGNVPESNRLGIELLKEAISLDPEFTDAVGRLSWRYVWEARMGRIEAIDTARAYAEEALRLDPESFRAHLADASVLSRQRRLAGVRAYRRAHALAPSEASVLTDLSWALAYTGQLEEALDYAYRAVQLEPNDPGDRWHAAVPLLILGDDRRTEAWLRLAMEEFAGQPDRNIRNELTLMQLDLLRGRTEAAREQALSALRKFAGQPEPELWASEVLLWAGDLDGARPVLEAARPDAVPAWGQRTVRTYQAFLLWERGEREAGARLFAEAVSANEAFIESGADFPTVPLEMAAIHAVQGNTELAYDWLEQVLDAGLRMPRTLAVDPMFASLRGQERFERIVERMALDVERRRANVERDGIAAGIDAMIAAGR
jgi:TolB-like protein/Flp pilus assembly protein TadD